ncbi:MAG: NAD-dependent epimerase/dehydratase family protein [Chloroflexi bacterium]|nr:NAD-dependent epimerase/dehydratase family protein [Chloroflexota bacterium]
MSNELHIVFGAGPLGRSVVNELAKQGKRTRVITRSGKMPDAPDTVEVISGDAYDSNNVRELTKEASVVYQCAQPGYTQWVEKFPPLQKAIIEGVAANRAKLIIGENLYMYGDTDGAPLIETLPYAAHTRKGKVRAQMAEAALAAHQSGKVRVAIARGSDFFGRYATGSAFGERLFYPAIAGKAASLTGNADLPHTATFIDDFGKALVILGERDEALGQAWHVPNNQPQITQRQFANLVFEELKLAPKVSSMSRLMIMIGGLFIPDAREVVEMMYEFEKPFVVDSSTFEKAFGMKPTPIREAIRQTVAWYKANPPR